MDELERAAELIDGALDSLAIAAARQPKLAVEVARRCERLRQLRDEIEAAKDRTRPSDRVVLTSHT